MDYTTITDAVDFANVLTGFGVVLAAVAGLYVAWKGGKILVRAIRGA